eukprot:PLAT12496.19.p1 GENE.PLAT12496.19~~PLAT12496.19.p1  ORF type:complete len:1397 (+),score=834.47 PLAT12496.19:82-4272(+)
MAGSADDRDSGVEIEMSAVRAASGEKGGKKAAKTMYGLEDESKQLKNREEESNFFTFPLFSFLTPLVALGRERRLEPEDIGRVYKWEAVRNIYPRFEESWKKKGPSLMFTVIHMLRWRLAIMGVFGAIQSCVPLAGPLLLEQIVLWLGNPAAPASEGYTWAALLAGIQLLGALLNSHNTHIFVRGWMQMRSSLQTFVYRRSVRLTNTSRQASTVGEIVNLMSSDADKVGAIIFSIHQLWLVPAQIAVILWLLDSTLGGSAFTGLGIMLGIVPILAGLIIYMVILTKRRLAVVDQRVRLTNEVLQGVQIVKFYAWEESFQERLCALREKEMQLLKKAAFANSSIVLFFMVLPVAVSLGTFAVYVAYGGELSPALVFRSLALFNALRFPLINLPSAIAGLLSGLVSAHRMERFLTRDELPPEGELKESEPTGDTVYDVSNALFRWAKAPEEAKDGKGKDGKAEAGKAEAGEAEGGKEEGKSSAEAGDGTGDGSADDAADGAGVDVVVEEEAVPFELRVDRFTARRGALTAIVGTVGSGKSTLLSALLGEVDEVGGEAVIADVPHRVGYVAQTSWIQNMTLRQNILFGSEYDEERYNAAVECCALRSDLDILPGGDETEIGDKGINLSGGQKQRVALCRAVYSRSHVYVMDDPLSAVDANVGKHIFDKCIKGALAGKTRVLVTNQLHVLPECDFIYTLEDGAIIECGTYEELMEAGGVTARLVKVHEGDSEDEGDNDDDDAAGDGDRAGDGDGDGDEEAKAGDKGRSSSSMSTDSRSRSRSRTGTHVEEHSDVAIAAGKQLVEEEERADRSVSWDVYKAHWHASGGCKIVMPLMVMLVLGQASVQLSEAWLAGWSEDRFNQPHGWYLQWYGIIGLASGLLFVARGLLLALASVQGSRTHHNILLARILRAPATFFDATPVGRILNRFSKDMESVDSRLPPVLGNLLGIFAILAGNLVSVAFVTPWFILPLALATALFIRVQSYYKHAALGVQRLESVARSPIFQHFTETLNGATTVRAFRAVDSFVDINRRLIDRSTASMALVRMIFRWAMLRLELMNALLTGSTAIILVLQRDNGGVDVALAGLALNWVLSIGGFLGFAVIMATEVENQMNSVERLHHYSHNVEQEAEWTTADDPADDSWPAVGAINFDGVTMKYREGLEPALRGLRVKVRGGEKMGVCGRTGSGKSTLMLCLFRLYELEAGTIEIDGVDISTIGLHTLRRKLGIIPQDPVLFSGTLRGNLDPFEQYSDEQLWNVLRQCQLDDSVRKLDGQLKAPVVEFGENFSVGERQLICLGRALLRSPRILIMDEATSSVDTETDAAIQACVRREFDDSTVLAIAHRLNTIVDSDRVVVLGTGRMRELDTPAALVEAGGEFAEMWQSAGSPAIRGKRAAKEDASE